jgi:hypothetical protein
MNGIIYLPKFHENLPIGSKVITGGTQTGDVIGLLSFFGKQAKNERTHTHTHTYITAYKNSFHYLLIVWHTR